MQLSCWLTYWLQTYNIDRQPRAIAVNTCKNLDFLLSTLKSFLQSVNLNYA
ncbi:hypothetical protein I8752_15225 [Nostocaceae cyanobacterium CENA369]|uniref:Uncharacterized protein n=1 Tax=Dendronalium phyllosphericum CENA369 TaxID=1725256 RepID=A0A8J7LEN1_9NOST|nr:hypothetical protein [Dendronalium phyllosphericum]MBH8574346.1 hypothetical protein [Dendronalium phyllosphericum CENA369]